MKMIHKSTNRLCAIFMSIMATTALSASAESLVYEGTEGIGKGKHLVWLAGDHEYRSEETMPMMARLMAKHHGFKCTVLFTVDPKSGYIDPAADHMPGTEALKTADLMCIFLRFKNLPDEQMQPIVDYLDRGGPVIGLRTATHAFNIPKGSTFERFHHQYKGEDYMLGFGRQVLGETWAGHYGKNHKMSTRLDIIPEAKDHPILRGVEKPWVQAGGYWTNPMPNSKPLMMAQPLNGMTPDSPVADGKKPCPGAWTRTYKSKSGKEGRVFTTTYGASEDILNDGFRRTLANACLWAIGMEDNIKADLKANLVGPYHPVTFSFKGNRQEVKPLDLAGWNSPIMPPDNPVGVKNRKKPAAKKKAG